jgi:hypothetical protein
MTSPDGITWTIRTSAADNNWHSVCWSPSYVDHDYKITKDGGADGADKIIFAAAPAPGDRITYDFTGNLKVRCRFEEDYQDFETFWDRAVNMGIVLRGLLNE